MEEAGAPSTNLVAILLPGLSERKRVEGRRKKTVRTTGAEPGGGQGEEDGEYDGWEARLVDLSRDRNFSKVRHGRGPGYKQGVPRQRVIDAYDALKPMLDPLRVGAGGGSAAG